MKTLKVIFVWVACYYISVRTMEAPPDALTKITYSRLELLFSDVKIHIIKDIIGQSESKQQVIKALRTFLAADRKLQMELDPHFLYRMENLLGWAWYQLKPNSFIPDTPTTQLFKRLSTSSKTFDRSVIIPDLLLATSCSRFPQLWVKMCNKTALTDDDLNDMELNYQYQASINPANSEHFERFTPLCAALHLDNGQAVEEILKAGANPNKTTRISCTSPLHLAATQGNARAVSSLLAHGVMINERTRVFKRTALHLAAENKQPTAKHSAVYWLLIDAGIDRTPLDDYNRTAQYYFYTKSDHL
jgi:hypothetical protein